MLEVPVWPARPLLTQFTLSACLVSAAPPLPIPRSHELALGLQAEETEEADTHQPPQEVGTAPNSESTEMANQEEQE